MIGLSLGLRISGRAGATTPLFSAALTEKLVGLYDASTLDAAHGATISNVADALEKGPSLDLGSCTYGTDGNRRWFDFSRSVTQYLGSDDPAFRITGPLLLMAGVHKVNEGQYFPIMSCQTNAATVNQYEWRFNNVASSLVAQEFVAASSSIEARNLAGPVGVPQATDVVVSIKRDTSTVTATLLHAGAAASASAIYNMVPTADANSGFRIGSRKGSPLYANGRIYCAAVCNSLLTNEEFIELRTYIASKSGVTFRPIL